MKLGSDREGAVLGLLLCSVTLLYVSYFTLSLFTCVCTC